MKKKFNCDNWKKCPHGYCMGDEDKMQDCPFLAAGLAGKEEPETEYIPCDGREV